MNEVTTTPAAAPAPPVETPPPPAAPAPPPPPPARTAVLLGMAGAAGMAMGILLTTGVFASYGFFFTRTLSTGQDGVKVFEELNALRLELRRDSEDTSGKDDAKLASLREILSNVATASRQPDGGTPPAAAPNTKPSGAVVPAVERPRGPFAEVDEEIERLEKTQKVLHTILDLFTRERKDKAKSR